MAVSFTVSKAEAKLVGKIVARAEEMLKRDQPTLTKAESDAWCREVTMDLMACHANGCPMDFQKLLGADDFNFAHDVWGIRRKLNRTTGELEDFFLPRCAKPEGGSL